jgi:hypothetical protein
MDKLMLSGSNRERNEALYHKGIDKLELVEPLRVLCLTWNMARKKLIVKPEQLFINASTADIIVAGFQESAMMNQGDV